MNVQKPLGPFALNWQRFIDLGYSPVPLYPCGSIIKGKLRDKSPCFLDWSPKLRERVITREEAERRLSSLRNAEIGVVCAFNRLTGVDIDTLDKQLQAVILAALPPAPTRCGNPAKAGLLLFQWGGDGEPPNRKYPDRNGDMIVELLGVGAQFVMPPSTHPSGVAYRMSCGDIPPVAELPILLQEHVDAMLTVIGRFCKAQPSLNLANACPRRPVGEFAPTGDFFADVNTLALQNLSAWVPSLFGVDAVARSSADQGYRVSSEALGRDLQEDLSLHPTGCKDFGLHDQNDEREGKRSPIDVVMAWGEPYGVQLDNGETPSTPPQAARWLMARLEIDPDAFRKASDAARTANFLEESDGEADFLTESRDEADAEGDEPPDPLTDEFDGDTAEETAPLGVLAWRRARGKAGEGVSLDDFHAYMPTHSYIFAPTREMWPSSSVNSRIPPIPLVKKNGKPPLDEQGQQKTAKATAWLDRNRPVEQATWAPGEPELIRNRLISDGGWIERKKVTCFNLYRPPTIKLGDPNKAGPWVDHTREVFGDDADHIINWLAQRRQHPEVKINHALVLGGNQGIGKDSLLEPAKHAVGPWNFSEVSPKQTLGRFNGFLKSVLLRISEARDLGDVDRFAFYDHMKAYTAAPPDVLRVDEKHLREHNILNCCGVIVTTNHKSDGIYLPADDRRHFVAWSNLSKEHFAPAYWKQLWGWYASGGYEHVAAYLAELDISGFDPKAPPPKTPAFWEIVDASRAPEDAELADVLDAMGSPAAATLIAIVGKASGEIREWLTDRKNRRIIPHRLERCGYVPVRNDAAMDGLWKIGGRRQAIYAKQILPIKDRLAAAAALAR